MGPAGGLVAAALAAALGSAAPPSRLPCTPHLHYLFDVLQTRFPFAVTIELPSPAVCLAKHDCSAAASSCTCSRSLPRASAALPPPPIPPPLAAKPQSRTGDHEVTPTLCRAL